MGNTINVSNVSLHDNLNINTMIPIPCIKLRTNMFILRVTVSVITVVSDVRREVMSPEIVQIYEVMSPEI